MAAAGISRHVWKLGGNLMETGMTMHIQEERDLDRVQVQELEAGLGSMAGYHGNLAAYCKRGCLGRTVLLCVQLPQNAFFSFSFSYFETTFSPENKSFSNLRILFKMLSETNLT